MFDHRRPIWNSALLHAVLIGGALVFTLPYVWLAGTSFKLDQEVQSAEIEILPRKPVPTPASPYIDPRQFDEIARPEQVDDQRWTNWMKDRLEARIGQVVDAWRDDRRAALPDEPTRTELLQGVFSRLVKLIPVATWQDADEAEFTRVLDKAATTDLVRECFAQAYRSFAVSTIRLQTTDYQVHDLTGKTPVHNLWHTTDASARPEQDPESGPPTAVVRYDFTKADRFEISAAFKVDVDLSDPQTGFKRLEVGLRSDQTWHELRLLVEMDGKLYRSAEPRYLAEAGPLEVRFQLPGPDDDRLVPKRYILLERTATGDSYDHGPGRLVVRVQVQRSGQLEAYWAKCSHNYRRAFDEVPFWRYFKTSAFLVFANIIGTLLSCSLAAYAFARLKWPGRDLCFILVLATLMIPPQVTMIPSFVIYKYLGWYNTLAPLCVPNCLAVNGFAIFLLRQAMKGIPRDLEEAARIDGCSHWGIYWNIILPLVKPTLAAISIFTFMFVWNDFLTPLIYVNDQRLYPLALGLFSFMVGRENQFTLIMAGSMIMTLPVIVTFFLAQRYFIQGVTMSGMKQ